MNTTLNATRVLLIEDDEVFRSLVENYLTTRGYHVITASDGEEGVEACQSKSPELILCDLMLPNMSGLDVLQSLLTNCHDIPVIVISASEEMADIREAVRLGAWDYLIKPLHDLEVLELAIHNCLDRYQLEDAHAREVWELDSHIDVLYQNDAVVERLAQDLRPQGALEVGGYRISCNAEASASDEVLIEFQQLTEGRVLVVAALANAAAGQTLISLLVLKTLINPIVRQALSGTERVDLVPGQLMNHLNTELCHSKIRTAYDIVLGVLDTYDDSFNWSQAGEQFAVSATSKADLSLGIWQQATYRSHRHSFQSEEQLTLTFNDAQLILQRLH